MCWAPTMCQIWPKALGSQRWIIDGLGKSFNDIPQRRLLLSLTITWLVTPPLSYFSSCTILGFASFSPHWLSAHSAGNWDVFSVHKAYLMIAKNPDFWAQALEILVQQVCVVWEPFFPWGPPLSNAGSLENAPKNMPEKPHWVIWKTRSLSSGGPYKQLLIY